MRVGRLIGRTSPLTEIGLEIGRCPLSCKPACSEGPTTGEARQAISGGGHRRSPKKGVCAATPLPQAITASRYTSPIARAERSKVGLFAKAEALPSASNSQVSLEVESRGLISRPVCGEGRTFSHSSL